MAQKGPVSFKEILANLQNRNKSNVVEYSQPTGNMKRLNDYSEDKRPLKK